MRTGDGTRAARLLGVLDSKAIGQRFWRALSIALAGLTLLGAGEGAAQTADAWFQNGLRLGEQRDYRGAVQAFSRAIQLDPKHVRAYYYRGQSHHFLGDNDLAIADYTRAIELQPSHPPYYMSRIEARRDKGDLDGALADADLLVALMPLVEQRNSLAFPMRGGVFHVMGLAHSHPPPSSQEIVAGW